MHQDLSNTVRQRDTTKKKKTSFKKSQITNIPDNLSAVNYEITNVLENFGNDLKQQNEDTPKRLEKLETFFMVTLNTCEGNIQ